MKWILGFSRSGTIYWSIEAVLIYKIWEDVGGEGGGVIQINQSTRIIASMKVGSKRNKPNCVWLRAIGERGGRCDLLSVSPTPPNPQHNAVMCIMKG